MVGIVCEFRLAPTVHWHLIQPNGYIPQKTNVRSFAVNETAFFLSLRFLQILKFTTVNIVSDQ